MRRVFLTLAGLAALGLAGAGAVVGLGLYNVSAQVGHLPGVSWVLHTTFRNSVRLRAPSMDKAPRLDDPDLIALGAGHFATACAGCHAAPGQRRSATIRAMVPVPPDIQKAVAHWPPNELHWIVENGVKMSGMPGWPVTGRGDEVWAVVAYLVSLQNGAAPDLPQAGPTAVTYCKTCHGPVRGPVPRLDILEPTYIETQLNAYLDAKRPSGIMAQATSLANKSEFGDLARALGANAPDAHQAGGPPALAPSPTQQEPQTEMHNQAPTPDIGHTYDDMTGSRRSDENSALLNAPKGETLARRGTRDVPACLACHGPETSAKGPVLMGQPETFLENQLKLWKDGTYQHDKLMRAATRDLSEDEISALAQYFSGQE